MQTKEINLEEKIEEYLITKGGYDKSNRLGFDSLKGYKTSNLIKFIKTTQSKNWKKLEEIHGSITEEYFLKMVEKVIKNICFIYCIH